MRRGLMAIPVLLALAVWMQPAESAIIFSNFVQPGNQFGPDPVGVGAIPVPGIFAYSAANFTPAMTFRLTDLELPLAVVSGPSAIAVLLYADAGNVPGGLLESFHVTGFPVPGAVSLTPVLSSVHPVLNAGSQYWVAVTGGSPSTFALWDLTLLAGNPQAGGASRSMSNGVDLGWTRNAGTRVGAMQVDGDPIPEPGSTVLIGAGLVLMFYTRKSTPTLPCFRKPLGRYARK